MTRAPRIGLVLGAGGITGGAFHAAVLAGLADELGWDARHASVIVGTSAGSVAGASLRAGLSPADMLARSLGRRLSTEGQRLVNRAGVPSAPPLLRRQRPVRRRVPEPGAVVKAAAGALRARPAALLATLIPEGTVPTAMITEGVEAITGNRWPTDPLLVCAVDVAGGQRVVFGRDDGPRPPLGQAVAASCAIPGFFEPVSIDGARYVDGGAHSPTNADVLRHLDLDLIIVSSPMSIAGRTPRLAADEPMRRWARTLLDAEALRIRRRRIPIVAFQPNGDDAAVMGINAMDPDRRVAVAEQITQSVQSRLNGGSTREKLRSILDR